jgi:hypothetical protein
VRTSTNTSGAILVILIGAALAVAGLCLLAHEISGDLTPLVYFVMIGLGGAGVLRGIRVYRDSRRPS